MGERLRLRLWHHLYRWANILDTWEANLQKTIVIFFSKEAEKSRFLCAILQTVGLLNVTSVLDNCASGLAL